MAYAPPTARQVRRKTSALPQKSLQPPWAVTSPCLSRDRISATTGISARTHVGDTPAHACDLDAFPRLRIEVNSRDRSAGDRGSDVPVSARGQCLQRPYGVHSANVGNFGPREWRKAGGARWRTRGASIRSPRAGPLFASALILRVPASLTVGAAVVILVISAGETIVIAAMVFGRTGVGRLGRERQNDGARGDGDRELQRFLLMVFRPRSERHSQGGDAGCAFHGPSCRNFRRGAKSGFTAPFPARSPCPCSRSSASPRRRRRQWT